MNNCLRSEVVLACLLFSAAFTGRAQKNITKCGADEVSSKYQQSHPAYAAELIKQKQDWYQHAMTNKLARKMPGQNGPVYEVPVVVHVIHTGGAIGTQYNPSDAKITAWIDYLTQSFQATWPTYVDVNNGGVALPIKFALAKRSPSCQPTTGIVRVNGTVLPGYEFSGVDADYNSGITDSMVKSLSDWPNDAYYNIWIVNLIDSGLSGVAGYALFPGAPANLDGAVIPADFADTGINALVHELGHSFGLQHTFAGNNNEANCPPNGNCLIDGDGFCDTEPHQFYGCSTGTNNCTMMPYAGVQYNFMDYSTCQDRFTHDQANKMVFVMETQRRGLAYSLGAIPLDPPLTVATAQCMPGIANTGNGSGEGVTGVRLADLESGSGTYAEENNQQYIDRTMKCDQPALAHLQGLGTYTVVVHSGNASLENMRVWIDYNNDGTFQPTEMVLDKVHSAITPVDSQTFTLPSTVQYNTNLRMRVISDDNANIDPCTNVNNGQVEDYAVTIAFPAGVQYLSEAKNVIVYPTVATDKLTVDGVDSKSSTWITNTVGQKINVDQMISNGKIDLNVSGLSSGVYFVMYQSNGSVKATKFVKQ